MDPSMTAAPAEPKRPNVALLRQTLAHIETHPEEWNQQVYRCRTGMCFAGWAVELDGGQWAAEPDHVDRHVSDEDLLPRPDDPANHIVDGLVDVRDRAERILGLHGDQAFDLFDANNTLPMLRQIVSELCADAEAVPGE